MPALTSDRNTPMRLGDIKADAAAAAAVIHAGAIVMRNAAGFLTQGATAAGAVGAGRADNAVNNSAGAAGAVMVEFRPGIFRYANHGADPVAQDDVGKLCYIVDDQTVAATDGAGTRSRAGVVDGLDSGGVWVRFDEALARAL